MTPMERLPAAAETQAMRSAASRSVLDPVSRASEILFRSRDVILRVFLDPRMIEPGMVGDEVEHQAQTTLAQPLPQTGQRRIPAQTRVHGVPGNRKT